MQKNEEKIGIVSNLGMDGEGVLIEENKPIFIPFSLPTEKIKYRILKVTSKCAYGKVLEVFTPSDDRVRPKCPVFFKCGGCQLQHLRYNEQLKLKENKITTCFRKIAGLDVQVLPTIKGVNEYRYRNKLQLPVGEINGKTIIGFYAENSHRIIEIEDCPINPEWTKNIISAFYSYINEFKLKGYNEQDFSGDLREIAVKEIDGKLIITVVCPKPLEHVDRLIEIIKSFHKGEFSLFLNINDNKTNFVYGNDFRLCYGNNDYSSEMLGIKYKIGVRSFMQVNPSVCQKLYSAVCNEVSEKPNSTVIDAYSGAGLMTAILAQKTQGAIGIEIIKEAVDIADEIAKSNGLSDKMKNYCGDCAEILPKVIKEQKELNKKITLVLDPPRKGCDISVIDAVIKSDIDKIVYVSCKPSTLARDIGLIVGSLVVFGTEIKRVENYKPRYSIKSVKPFDMFSQTKHIETLCVLERINHNI
ncbi:MAG: 23S rRNA (uracil(1939)-C(5))-methyltransferase RlmD [Clostridia bacterium]|nr:23S rRNA (uracil(1939)-C(5))-methyltransferase RlmD [Clostridia bacterium]